jgi:hypothetical protein
MHERCDLICPDLPHSDVSYFAPTRRTYTTGPGLATSTR